MLQSVETTIDKDNEIVHEPLVVVNDDQLRSIVEISPIAAFTLDENQNITAANRQFAKIVGRQLSDLIGTAFRKLIVDSKSQRVYSGQLELLHSNGSSLSAEAFCRPLPGAGQLVFVNDNTDQIRAYESALDAERKRWQSQRIEALGRLAGGIAHDFNNFLAVLLLQVDILNLNLEPDSPIRERVNDIKEVSNAAAGTVRQLFAFGRKQPMTLAPADVNTVVSRFADEFGETSEIDLHLSLSKDLGLCFVDQMQILQVLRNLAANAKTGMSGRGRIVIATANRKLDGKMAQAVQPPGEYVEITVSDNGARLDAADEEFIFEPFFSSEDTGKGAGLTLAMVYGIVKQSKGFIWAENDALGGKTFRLQFPRIDVSSEPVNNDSQVIKGSGETRTVLLVDDEEAVRRVTAEFLKMSDYEVLQAASGMEAIEIAQSFNKPIHLLLTDLSMPLMDGVRLADQIVRMHHETSVLYMSGNIEHIGNESITNADDINFIGKPFSSVSLARKVRDVLTNADG